MFQDGNEDRVTTMEIDGRHLVFPISIPTSNKYTDQVKKESKQNRNPETFGLWTLE